MSIRRPALALIASLLVGLLTPGASAQEPSAARLTLLHQTPWNSPKEQVVRVDVLATNEGSAPLEELSLGIALYGAVRTRTDYEASLEADPPAEPVWARLQEVEGLLLPEEGRTLQVEVPLDVFGVDQFASFIYPLKLELRSQGLPIAVLRTPVIYLVEEPQTPLTLSWSLVLHHPYVVGPDGTFTSTALEEAVLEGGSVASVVAALEKLIEEPRPIDLVVSPPLMLQLERMATGYAVVDEGATRTVAAGEGGAAAAEAAIEALRRVAGSPAVEVTAFPFSAVPVPSLLDSGLGTDLEVQLERGRAVVRRVLEVSPRADVFMPPASALDEDALAKIEAGGVNLLLLEPAAVPPAEQLLGFAPPATAGVATGTSTVTAVVANESVQEILASPAMPADPFLGAQSVLGEIAAIWLEQPSVERGLAIRIPETSPAELYGPLLFRLSHSPFVRTVTATDLAEAFPPEGPPSALVEVTAGSFSRNYVLQIRAARRQIDAYRSMLVRTTHFPDALETVLLLAEGGQYIEDTAGGLRLISWVHDALDEVFGKVRVETSQQITLTSESGTIPLRLTNDSGRPLRVVLELQSQSLQIQGGPIRELELDEASQTVTFDVELRRTGLFPVPVILRTPSGRPFAQTTLVVRSTAFNRIALVVTIAAAVLLVFAWTRRLLRRRTS